MILRAGHHLIVAPPSSHRHICRCLGQLPVDFHLFLRELDQRNLRGLPRFHRSWWWPLMLPPAATFPTGLLVAWLWPRLARLIGGRIVGAQLNSCGSQHGNRQVRPMDGVSIRSVASRARESTAGHTPLAGPTCSLQAGCHDNASVGQSSVLFVITSPCLFTL